MLNEYLSILRNTPFLFLANISLDEKIDIID